jgi:NADPH-dependent 2,4-dienoyl-CoA reductase/sulfur reductase-like enzyme/rhodanese-related sulfurtransferase
MKLIVIGAVAAGTSAAAKARRNQDDLEITIYEKDVDVSYSGCGLPYYIGNEVESIEALTPRDPAFFKKKYNIDIHTAHLVTKIDHDNQQVHVKNLETDETFTDAYDKLVIATGAKSIVPPIEGVDLPHVHTLRTVQDARQIKGYIDEHQPKKAVVVGTGFIGFEMLENLIERDIEVVIVEMKPHITSNLDPDMADYLEDKLVKKGIDVRTNTIVKAIQVDHVKIDEDETIPAELVILATGVKPNVELAKAIGVEIGETGAIKVNERMETNLKNVYSCGDCIETFQRQTNKPVYRPLGSTANKTGRIAGDQLSGGSLEFKGILGTSIYKLFELTVANTGLSEAEARAEGFDIEISHNIKLDKPAYFNGTEMNIKAIADRETKKLLGVQIVGEEGVDKRIDVFSTLITYGATVDELFHLDLAYAPPFSTTKDPVHYSGMILDNALSNGRPLKTSDDVRKLKASGEKIQIVDTRIEKQHLANCVDGAVSMPHAVIRERLNELDKNLPTVTYCNSGTTGNAVQNILLNHGFKDVSNLSGGNKFYQATKKKRDQ